MLINPNFTFEVSLSQESFKNKEISAAMIGSSNNENNRHTKKKYGYNPNKGVSFNRITLTSQQLLSNLLEGKVFCHLFNPSQTRKDGSFGMCQKKDENFEGSNVIGIDIDKTFYTSIEEYIDRLSIKPTFYYTSYSNLKDGKGLRFRLIYLFEEKISNPLFFRYCAFQLNYIIERDVEEKIEDDCNLRCSQYFNGTNINNEDLNISFGITDSIYSFKDINVSKEGYVDYLINFCNYKTFTKSKIDLIKKELFRLSNKNFTFNYNDKRFVEVVPVFQNNIYLSEETTTTQTIPINSKMENGNHPSIISKNIINILHDYDRLDEEEFRKDREWNKIRKETIYIYRKEKEEWINGLYQEIDNEYFSLFYYVNTQKDGMKRRKALFQRMCLRRLLKPSITKDEMVVNTIIDILRFFDNSDRRLDSDFIIKNVNTCFELTIEGIEKQYKRTINYLKENTTPKRGIIYINKQAHSKETTFYILDYIYNKDISVKENLDYINNDLGFIIKKSTIYNYLKEREIERVKANKLSDEEIKNLIDISISANKNQQFFKDNDIKVKRSTLLRLYKEKKEELKKTFNKTKEEKENTIDMTNEVILKIESIDAKDFFKSKIGIDEVMEMLNNFKGNINVTINIPTINVMMNDKINEIGKYSPYIADIAKEAYIKANAV